eukprot:3894445-Amphidinium_carterae.1
MKASQTAHDELDAWNQGPFVISSTCMLKPYWSGIGIGISTFKLGHYFTSHAQVSTRWNLGLLQS